MSVYAIGGIANEIFKSFKLTEDQVYKTVKQPFQTHFMGGTNVIFERIQFKNEFKAHRNL